MKLINATNKPALKPNGRDAFGSQQVHFVWKWEEQSVVLMPSVCVQLSLLVTVALPPLLCVFHLCCLSPSPLPPSPLTVALVPPLSILYDLTKALRGGVRDERERERDGSNGETRFFFFCLGYKAAINSGRLSSAEHN